jgi:hypothetical protein
MVDDDARASILAGWWAVFTQRRCQSVHGREDLVHVRLGPLFDAANRLVERKAEAMDYSTGLASIRSNSRPYPATRNVAPACRRRLHSST